MAYDDEYKQIKVFRNKDTKITEIILNRPKKKNTLTIKMLQEITTVLKKLAWDRHARVVVLKGEKLEVEGKLPAFSAGADLTSGFKRIKLDSPYHMAWAFKEIHDYFNMIEEFPKVLIAAVDGYAVGGGCELSLVCDLRIATKRSEFGLPELNLGTLPGAGGTQRLIKLIGLSRAKQMILLGEYISAEKAYDYGLVNFLVDVDDFESKINEVASKIASGPPIVQRVVKQAMNLGTQSPLDVGLCLERLSMGIIAPTKDAQEGLRAFMEKRKPEFSGK
ncbi:MAG: enoyl-CoA hydratase/isomerase family protein [Candidatus Helarchaeota archaeon]